MFLIDPSQPAATVIWRASNLERCVRGAPRAERSADIRLTRRCRPVAARFVLACGPRTMRGLRASGDFRSAITVPSRWACFSRSASTLPRNMITRLTEQHVDNGGSLSPDQRWLAYQSAVSGRSIVYVRSLSGAPAAALSRDPGEFPVSLRDGKTLASARGRQLVVRSWRDTNGRFEIGPERAVGQLAFGSGWTYGAPYDVADGGRFPWPWSAPKDPSP
jgi:hypothetical protein